MEKMNIGKIAELSGVTVDTVRFYERKGLVNPVGRSASGYRKYSRETVDRIRFVINAKGVGFTLKECGELLRLKARKDGRKAHVKAVVSAKITDISSKTKVLNDIQAALQKLEGSCDGKGPVEKCPILHALHCEH